MPKASLRGADWGKGDGSLTQYGTVESKGAHLRRRFAGMDLTEPLALWK